LDYCEQGLEFWTSIHEKRVSKRNFVPEVDVAVPDTVPLVAEVVAEPCSRICDELDMILDEAEEFTVPAVLVKDPNTAVVFDIVMVEEYDV